MKNFFILGLVFLGCFTSGFGQITSVWTGTASTDFFDPLNWQNGTVPGSSDNAVFDSNGGSNDCDLSLGTMVISSFSVLSGYNGTINFGPAGTGVIINGDLVINSATVLAAGDVNFAGIGSGNFILGASGTFDNTGGSVTMGTQSGQVFTFSGNIVIETLIISGGAGSAKRDINFGSNLTAVNMVFQTGAILTTSKIHGFQGNIHIKSTFDLGGSTYTSVPAGSNANFIFDGSNISITGSTAGTAGALRVPLPNFEINTPGTLSMTGQLNIQGNWTALQGTVAAGTSTVNMFGTSASISGPAAAFNNLNIPASAVVSMPAGEVKISGTLSRTGTLNFQSTSVLGLNGSGTQTVNLNGVTLAAIVAYSTAASRNVTLSGTINITDSLKAENNVQLATGGSLTLKASSTKTARLARVGTGASVTGNVTVETLIPGGTTGWSQLGVSGVSGQTFASWDTYPADPNGLPMTCEGCTYGVTATGNYFESIQGWLEPNDDYDTTLTVNTALTPGKGFWVYVGSVGNADIRLSNTGALVTGHLNVPVTQNTSGYNLLANPYACPISWDMIYSLVGSNNGGFSPTIYTYDPDNGDSQFISDGAGGIGTGGLLTGILAAGQGFYIEASNGATNVEFDEIGKVDNNTAAILKPAAAAATATSFRLKIAGDADNDDAIFRFISGATPFFDSRYDAHKLFTTPGYAGYPGTYSKYTSISGKDAFDEDYSIHSMPPLTQSVSIPVLAKVSVSGSYTLSAYDLKNFTSCILLHDKLTDTNHDLRAGDYVVTISDTTSVPRFELLLCEDASLNTVGIAKNQGQSNNVLISQDQQGAFVKTAFVQNTKANISVYNIMGQKLMEDIQVEGTATTTRLNLDLHNQVVLIRVATDKESTTKKMVLH